MEEIPEIDEVEERLDRLEERILEGTKREEPETKLDEIIQEHTNNRVEAFICEAVAKNFIQPIVERASPEEARWLVEEEIIIPKTIMEKSGTLRKISAWIARVGGRTVRDGWGDELTRDALFRYCRECVPQFEIVSDGELREWIELNLNWIRDNILGKSTVSDLVGRMKSALGGE